MVGRRWEKTEGMRRSFRDRDPEIFEIAGEF